LGTTRDFLDYFSLQKLDDLPTLAQLKELEDLRVQLSLPGADPVAPAEAASGDSEAAGSPGEAAGDDSLADDSGDEPPADDAATDDEELDASSGQHRPHGLVARGADDDQF
jgi:segregation and condensation protein B